MWNLRKKIYFKYQNFFKNYDVGMQIINDSLKNYKHAYHLFIIYFRNTGKTNIRNKLIQFFKKIKLVLEFIIEQLMILNIIKKNTNGTKIQLQMHLK